MNEIKPNDRLLIPKDIARICRVYTGTVRRWAERGILTPIRISAKCIRFRESDVARLLGGSDQSPAGEQ